MLGGIIQDLTGESLPDVVRDTVTGPLDLMDTDFAVPDRARLVTPYADGRPEPVLIEDGTVVPLLGSETGVPVAPSRALDPASYPSTAPGSSPSPAP